jgi:hypothetical protein
MGILKSGVAALVGLTMLFAASPTSNNYKLQTYDVGTGGSNGSASNTYKSTTITGTQSQSSSASNTYTAKTGLNPTQLANVPSAPTITNPSSYYNKLHIVINNGNNPSDATFAIAISPNGFSPTTNYIQDDNTVGATLGTEDWQTYSTWGGASGFDVIGLLPNTTYTVKVNAEHGDFTESGYSATASAATVGTSLTFDIDTSATDTETSSPYSVSFTNLTPNTVIDGTQKIWIDLDTNASSGAAVFIASANAGLKSTAANNTILSASANLSAVNEGYGAQNSSVTQSSGGPLTAQSPYIGASQTVGILDTSLRQIYTSAGPITAGRGSILLKARATSNTPAAKDYADILTLIASASF